MYSLAISLSVLAIVANGALAASCTAADQGVDVSAATTLAQFQCENQKGVQITVVQVGAADGNASASAKETIKNAIGANMAGVHYSIRPKYDENDPTKQINAALDASGNPSELSFPIVWIDVVAASGWSSTPDKNNAYLDKVISAVQKYYSTQPQLVLGLYTTQQDWKTITGDSQKYSNLYLWWSHNGSAPDCTEWDTGKPNGNWNTPLMKQFKTGAVDADCQNINHNKDVVVSPGQLALSQIVHNIRRQ